MLTFTYGVRATTCTVTWSPCSPENGARSLLPSKFRQFRFPSVKPNHTAPLVEGSGFSVSNSEQSCSSKMPFEGASLLSKGWGVHRDYSPCPGKVHTTTVLPVLYYLPSCSALVGTTEWKIKRHETGERELDHVAVFKFSPAGSL